MRAIWRKCGQVMHARPFTPGLASTIGMWFVSATYRSKNEHETRPSYCSSKPGVTDTKRESVEGNIARGTNGMCSRIEGKTGSLNALWSSPLHFRCVERTCTAFHHVRFVCIVYVICSYWVAMRGESNTVLRLLPSLSVEFRPASRSSLGIG